MLHKLRTTRGRKGASGRASPARRRSRKGLDAADEAPPASGDVPDDAPSVFHWLGVGNAPYEAASTDADDEPTAKSLAMFRRLGLSVR
jgi:hypothetical protein